MKIFALILGVFCLFFSAYPCCIFDDCENDYTEATAENEQDRDECGICSPFINCGNCNGFVDSPQEFANSFYHQTIASKNLFGTYFNCVENDYADRQWQPPKQVIIS